MLDVRLFRTPRFGVANLALTLSAFAQIGSLFVVIQYFQFVLGYSPIAGGFALLPEVAGLIIGAVVASRLQIRVGGRLPVAAGLAVMGASLLVASSAGVDSLYPFLGAVLFVVGIGAGLAYIPATDSVMGSLPKSRAGVGSAMNDTTRQVGSALGVAAIGALLASGYRVAIEPVLRDIPPESAAAVHDSIGAAVVVAGRIGGLPGDALLAAARSSFVSGMGSGLQGAALAMFVAAAVALVLLPGRIAEPELSAVPDATPATT